MDTKKTNEEIRNEDFDLTNLPEATRDPEIKKEDFVFTQKDAKVHDQKFQTKPTTFLKDSLRRFSKNKSSVVAAGILGVLLLLSVVVPIADRNDVSKSHPEIIYLEPKLFKAGTGFWDGTKQWKQIPVDTSEAPDATTEEEKQEKWWPNPERFKKEQRAAISKKEFTDWQFTSQATSFGKEGFLKVGYTQNISDAEDYVGVETFPLVNYIDATDHSKDKIRDYDSDVNSYISSFHVYDEEQLKAYSSEYTLPENYVLGETAVYFTYSDATLKKQEIVIIDYATSISIDVSNKVNISDKIKEAMAAAETPGITTFAEPAFEIRVKNAKNHQNTCVLIKDIKFETESANEYFAEPFVEPSFDDATECNMRKSKLSDNTTYNQKYWSTIGRAASKGIHMSKVVFCNFVWDSYEAVFGKRWNNNIPGVTIENYAEEGLINFYAEPINPYGTSKADPDTFVCEITNAKDSPLAEALEAKDVYFVDGEIEYVKGYIWQYKELGYKRMPIFLFGTDKSGRDMLKYVFEGLRTSLLLGIITTVICFLFGLAYGAISGYFGGTVDLVMERFTDILSGVPWIVVMTLVIIHLGQNLMSFAIALCLTGWIGTAATTRTQFYRFRGREYVLASRTLGASDARLIAKHILPNAMGTIITSAVLMIPSVIFSEATISYLGLGLKGLSSLGVILSTNQTELTTNPYLLIFPSVIIALLMISFNLAGNGLRDAVNPSLKGEEE